MYWITKGLSLRAEKDPAIVTLATVVRTVVRVGAKKPPGVASAATNRPTSA